MDTSMRGDNSRQRSRTVALVVGGLLVAAGLATVGWSMSTHTNPPAALSTSSSPGSTTSTSSTARTQGCVPTSIVAKTIGVDEAIKSLGLNSKGQIYPPPHTTMWYDKSVEPGSDGISVIAGHVTYDGPDNFYRLRDLAVGSTVTIRCADGRSLDLVVTSRASITKVAATTDARIWGSSKTPVVVLITCDIRSRMVDGHHLNNFVVWTAPAA